MPPWPVVPLAREQLEALQGPADNSCSTCRMILLPKGRSRGAKAGTEMGSGAREERATRAGLFAGEGTGMGKSKKCGAGKRKESKGEAEEMLRAVLGVAARQPWL